MPFIFGIVVVAVIAAGWSQFLEHRRREKALDIIKAAIEHGKEPPAIVYQEVARGGGRNAPWTEVVVFTSLAVGFWIAFANAAGDERRATAFLVVAATMSVGALGCLLLALLRPGPKTPGAPRDER
jgi:hypothetical protein